MIEPFFSLLRFAIGTSSGVPALSFEEVRQFYEIAKIQSLIGVLFHAMRGGELRPSDVALYQDEYEDLVMDWMGANIKVERCNKKLNQHVAEVTEWFGSHGFESCLLKGQGNALYYPNVYSRMSGDIDLWIRSKGHLSLKNDIRNIVDFVKGYSKNVKAVYHHVDGLNYHGTEVEVHYRPHFMQNFFYNARLQNYFLENADEQFANYVEIGGQRISVPTTEFNIVFQLSHIYQHLFNEGIGLRQIVDYFYLLQKCDYLGDERYKRHLGEMLRRLGLKDIAGAIMWILTEMLGMDRSLAIVESDERRGRFVLNEIMQGGNFGKYDGRNARFGHSKIGKNIQRLYRDVHMMRYFPSEALSEPLFRLWHAGWRVCHR